MLRDEYYKELSETRIAADSQLTHLYTVTTELFSKRDASLAPRVHWSRVGGRADHQSLILMSAFSHGKDLHTLLCDTREVAEK